MLVSGKPDFCSKQSKGTLFIGRCQSNSSQYRVCSSDTEVVYPIKQNSGIDAYRLTRHHKHKKKVETL